MQRFAPLPVPSFRSLGRRAGSVLLGTQGWLTSDRSEWTTRCFVAAFAIAPTLFVALELSPTAWAIAFVVLVGLCNAGALNKDVFAGFGPVVLFVAVSTVVIAASALWSLAPARSLHASFVFACYAAAAIVLVAIVRRFSSDQLRRIWSALAAGTVPALLCLAAYEVFVALTLSDLRLTQATGTLHKIAVYGFLFAAALLFPADGRISRLRLIFVGVVFAVPTFLLGKTTAITLLIPAAAVICLLTPAWRIRVLWAFAACYGLLALSAPLIAPPLFHLADQAGVLALPKLANASARLDLWHLMSPHILQAPLLGHGADTVRISSFLIQGATYYTIPVIPSAHNFIFDIWFELGLTGIALLLIALGYLIGWIVKLGPDAQLCAMLMFLCVVIELSVDHRLWLSWVYGMLIYAAVASALAARHESLRAGEPGQPDPSSSRVEPAASVT